MQAEADAQLASVLRHVLNEYAIYDVDTFSACVRGDAGDALADWLQSDAARMAAEQAAAAQVEGAQAAARQEVAKHRQSWMGCRAQ